MDLLDESVRRTCHVGVLVYFLMCTKIPSDAFVVVLQLIKKINDIIILQYCLCFFT